jgi:beta-propeller repeat-containing protein
MRRISINLLVVSVVVALLIPSFAPNVAGPPMLLFQKTWGGLANDSATGVAVDAANNTYVSGNTNSFGPNTPGVEHAVLLKYNSTGGLVWQRLWNGTATDNFNAVAVDRTTGQIVTVGFSASFSGLSAVILKFNSTGSLLWQHTWQDSSDQGAQGVAIDTSGNIYVTGWDGSGGYGTKVFVLKLNSSGSLLWQKTWGGTKDDEALAIAVDSYGYSYVTGYTTSFGAGGSSCLGGRTCPNILLLELDFNGNFVLQRIWGSTLGEYGVGIALDSNGNAYITGSTVDAGAGKTDLVLLKFSAGTLMFQKTWGGSGYDTGRSVSVDAAGNAYVAGTTNSFGASGTNVCLLKFNSTGTLLSQVTWGGTKTENGNAVAVNSAGDPVVAGSTNEGPPLQLSTAGNSTLAIPNFSPSNVGNSTLGLPSAILGTPAGTVSGPPGTETYAGQEDFFLFKYTSPTQPTPPPSTPPFPTLLVGVLVAVAAAAVAASFLVFRRRSQKSMGAPKPA